MLPSLFKYCSKIVEFENQAGTQKMFLVLNRSLYLRWLHFVIGILSVSAVLLFKKVRLNPKAHQLFRFVIQAFIYLFFYHNNNRAIISHFHFPTCEEILAFYH